MWTLVTSCLEPLNSATNGPAEHLKISEWSSCCVIDSGRMLFVPRLRGDGCHLNHDRWYEIVVRAAWVWPFVGSSSLLVYGGRGSIAAVSDEVLQWECMQLQSLWELQRNLWETTEKFMGAGFFGVEAEQHVSSFDDVPERAGQYFRLHSYWPRCRLMCLVYIRCLFCEASGTSSIGCFVCDLHRFSIKLNGSVKHWKTWYAYFKYTTRMGYVPPPRRQRYRTNLFVIVGLVQRIDDVSWSLCPVRVEIPKYYCLQPFYGIIERFSPNYSLA